MVRTTGFLLALMLLATPVAAQTSDTTCSANPYAPTATVNCQTTTQPAPSGPQRQGQTRSANPFADGMRRGQEMAARQQMQKEMKAGNCKAAFDTAVRAMLYDDARQIREFCPAAN